ncbi:two-component system response regulator VirG [Agrobacterium rhizogenes]|jgi:DNA-binding response OmpR family regulator|uniref:Regulatory protein VirG n=16 Tax=Rhizobium/Agrobacterium group TaxID=227290 RepID=VIRG_AGRFC|nr:MULTISPECIES: two-component system response regulator VirG [Rhizobium/Agrobacterium group]P07545.1 RecName: Full=Regulatory protein VirG [Agrobacterium fabrum str. C58]AAD15211.1 virulence protein [Plasmid pTiC58]AYD05087.1 two component system response regulator [Neorhizobium sp. NCHU2750]KAA6481485.1 DNA-binding response regulator [Agrobacterium sp. ICMP 7243]AAK90940.1 two component response regulator [Agrobacterium fabrum str. C58]ASK43177.1 DNA-binding response regulator [Agrobacteriu
MAGQDPRLRGEPLKHVLVIDDDVAMRHLIVEYLTIHAFKVTAVADSKQFNRVLCSETVDVVVVDLNLGREDGLEIVRSLATKSDVPIIIISGARLEEADKVIALELGATDFIAKPFGTREFLARIRVALRVRPSVARTKDRRSFSFADWTLNLRRRRLISEEGSEVKLTAGEFNLLVAFLEKPRDVLSREQLLIASRVREEEVYDRSIDVLILRLRRKLEGDPTTPQLIKTARGAGYFFDADVDVSYGGVMAA